ncbi:ly-6/neurotoxin-like neurotoxin 1 isoform X2 [Podarcis lilfordi]|uniref:Ly-6/neurotoxin-like neurotoxin 1 isoform X2 n=1 Tax=Podarcis lilfordi TaxID=74358 RepID=A0AA35JXN4_9SAUR|nr:ly-6/neurotoxin-like neurotoxin 1 isoform X2 [Podarcis lilfordi]
MRKDHLQALTFDNFFSTSAQGLVCKLCHSGNGKACYSTEETCKTRFGKCYTYTSYLDDELYFMSYGCVSDEYWEYCNAVQKDGKYTHIDSCCDTDKCNGKALPLPRGGN